MSVYIDVLGICNLGVLKEKRGGSIHEHGAKSLRRVSRAQEGNALPKRRRAIRSEQIHRVQGEHVEADERRSGETLPGSDHRPLLRLLLAFREMDERLDQTSQRHHERAKKTNRLRERHERAVRPKREDFGRAHRRHSRNHLAPAVAYYHDSARGHNPRHQQLHAEYALQYALVVGLISKRFQSCWQPRTCRHPADELH